MTPSVLRPCISPFRSTAPQKASAYPPWAYPLTNCLVCVANSLRPSSLLRLNLSRFSCSITFTLRCGQSAGFFISAMIFRNSYCSFTSEMRLRRVASVARAAWNAVATLGKIKPWQQTQQGQSMLRNQQYPWNCRMGGASTFVYFLPSDLFTSFIQYNNTHTHTHHTLRINHHCQQNQQDRYGSKLAFQKQNIIIFFRIMIKRPTIINMSLTALKDPSKPHETISNEKNGENYAKNSQLKEEMAMQDIITFVKLVADERTKAKNKEKKASKELGKTICKPEKQLQISIPFLVCESVEILLRKYMLYKMEERQEGARSKPKMAHERISNIRTFLRTNKENDPQQQEEEEDELFPFRSMTAQKIDRERIIQHNLQLEAEVTELRERLKEKNGMISKLVSKETQLRRKYNEQFSRLIRNKNIYDISTNFERQEEEGEGRNALNVAGRHLADHTEKEQEEYKGTSYFKPLQKPAKSLLKCDSQYIKNDRPHLAKSKNMLHPFRNSKKQIENYPVSHFLKTINKSLPTQCITRRQIQASNRKEPVREKHTLQDSGRRPTFQLYVNQLESTPLSKKQSFDVEFKKGSISKMRDEQFEALQMHGFYNEQNLKEIDTKLKI